MDGRTWPCRLSLLSWPSLHFRKIVAAATVIVIVVVAQLKETRHLFSVFFSFVLLLVDIDFFSIYWYLRRE